MVCQQLDFRIVCGDAHNTLEWRGSSTERHSTMTGKYKTLPRLVIQISASVESMTLEAAPRNPRRARLWKTIRKTAYAMPSTVTKNRIRSCAMLCQAGRIPFSRRWS
jgi:hypothetical protein